MSYVKSKHLILVVEAKKTQLSSIIMIFTTNAYDTPEGTKQCIWDIFALKTRFYFVFQFLYIIFKANKVAKHGHFNDAEYCKISDNTFKLVESCGAKIHVSGLENISDLKEPVVFISNHMSVLETFLLPGLIIPFRPVSFIVKESLINHPFFGQVMKATNPVSVSRTDPKKDFKTVMTDGQRLLKEGRSIIVFPQSTRGEFIADEFNSIGEKLAQKANVPIVPIALKTDFWSVGRVIKDFGPIHRKRKIFFEFGEPISCTMEKKQRHSHIIDFIQSNLKKWYN